jgi:alginate O-acetyltransferase complex protein AlgJ
MQEEFKKNLAALPKDQMGIVGSDGWLFFRKSVDYILAPDLSHQSQNKNPLPYLSEFKKYLDGIGINFLFVAVPCKEELYYQELGIQTTGAIVAPNGRKMLSDLQKNGIEVIDLLPRFLEAKTADALSTETVYQKQDTHWTNRGLQVAANLIADRIKQYAWYDAYQNQKKPYTGFDTTFLRQGDIVERIPEAARINYAADTLDARQIITPEGKKYKPDPTGPILLIGDSFTGVFELVDCKSAGVGANIAEKSGLPVDILTGWGGGPMIMNKMIRVKKNTLGVKRLVIYMMTARDLYDYSQGWEKLSVE